MSWGGVLLKAPRVCVGLNASHMRFVTVLVISWTHLPVRLACRRWCSGPLLSRLAQCAAVTCDVIL